MNKTGPSINKGKSRQDYETPLEFIAAVTKRFGPLETDLACDEENAKAPRKITPAINSLNYACQWRDFGLCWLNPPYGIIGPWAKKCYAEACMGAKVLMLVPASVGSNWFADYVHEKAFVLFLRPRLTFEGADDPYPKDLMLCCFGFRLGYECWKWK